MILERGRNEPCACGSGKKFKKCCINNQYDDFKDITLLDENFPDEAFQDGREPLNDADIELMQYAHAYIYNPSKFPDESVLYMLNYLTECRQRCPNNPSIINLLCNIYSVQKQTELAHQLLSEIKTRFPYYIYGRVMCAQEALEREEESEALGYLNNCQTLREFDPRRSVFHMGEAAVFHGILIECYLPKGDDAAVSRHYNNLLKIVSMNPGRGYDRYINAARESIDRWQTAKEMAYEELVRTYLRKKIFGDDMAETDLAPEAPQQDGKEFYEINN